MKLAGAKNSGAWHRFNRFLLKGNEGGPQSVGTKTALKNALLASLFIDAYYNALSGLAADAGFSPFPATKDDLVQEWMDFGIPLQVWMGRMSWTAYDRTGEPGDFVYTPRAQSEAHYFGKDVRRICRHFQASWREISDLINTGNNNPGQLPDAERNSAND